MFLWRFQCSFGDFLGTDCQQKTIWSVEWSFSMLTPLVLEDVATWSLRFIWFFAATFLATCGISFIIGFVFLSFPLHRLLIIFISSVSWRVYRVLFIHISNWFGILLSWSFGRNETSGFFRKKHRTWQSY